MPGHHFFCAEWRRMRKVLPIEEDLLYEFIISAPSWDYVPVDSSSEFVQTNDLQGWIIEIEQDLFNQIRETFESTITTRGRSTIYRERSPQSRRSLHWSQSPRRCRSPSPSPGRATRSPTLRSIPPVSQPGPSRPVLFKNPKHPLSNLPEALGRMDFVAEMRKRLHPKGLFRADAEMTVDPGGAGQGEGNSMFSAEECEDLFEVLLQLQKIAGNHSSAQQLAFGHYMDDTVDTFYGILALRFAVERGAPSLNALLGSLEAKDSTIIDAILLRQFLGMVNYRLESQAQEVGQVGPDPLPIESIVKAHSGIETSEFRHHLSFAAPVGRSLSEVHGHLEVKHGFGRAKLPGFMDCAQLGGHFCGVEHLDISPLDLSRFFRIWGGAAGGILPPLHLEEHLVNLPLEADWGLEHFAVEQTFNALGLRCLQLERHKRKDACLLPQAILELTRRDGDLEKAEVLLPEEGVLQERFEVLWNHCVGEGLSLVALEGESSIQEGEKVEKTEKTEKEKSEQKESKDTKERHKEKELAGTAKMKEACMQRYVQAARELAQRPVSRLQFDSIFPNVSDILAISNVNLRAGQVVVVRYRLAGACNFWHPKHRVLKDEREPLAWPVPSKVLGETPFVALVPRGLRWTNAGGGGFYLGSQAFNQVDPGLRADLPLDRDGKLLLYGTVEFVAPYLLRGMRRNASSATEELEFRLFSSRKNRIIGCVGEPLRVQVTHQALPPAVATLQVCCEGRNAKLRWAGYDLGEEVVVQVESVRLNVRTDRKETLLDLDPEAKQYEMTGLLPDTDYEFHLRLESHAGAGREATCCCRTNSRCTQPLSVASAGASTTYVDLQWRAPEVIGNERTQDRWQLHREKIIRYEAQLSIAEVVAKERKSLLKSRTSLQLRSDSSQATSCRWHPPLKGP